MNTNKIILILVCIFLYIGCTKENLEVISQSKILPENTYAGFHFDYIITHKDDFSYFNPDSNKVFGKLYEYINEETIEGKIIDFHLFSNKGYIITDTYLMKKINCKSFLKLDIENEIVEPNYINYAYNLLFITAGNESGTIYRYDIFSDEITGSAEVGRHPTKAALFSDYLLVINSVDSTVSILRNNTEFETERVIKLDFYPLDIIIEDYYEDNIWMLGIRNGEEKGIYVLKYNLIVDNVTEEVKISDRTETKTKLIKSRSYNQIIYCLIDEGLFTIQNIFDLPESKHEISGDFNDFIIDHKRNSIYLINSYGEEQNGTLYKYDLDYNLIDSIAIDPEPIKISTSSNY